MKRRNFVKNISLGALAAPFAFNGINYQTSQKKPFNLAKSTEDRVLILIRLNGGNDGLNTIIPMNSYDTLQAHRANVILPQNSILSATNSLGMHPALSGMHQLFQDGKLSIIQNVGYPEQNRSHFRSMDIWSTGSLDQSETRGWLGRRFDQLYPDYPDGFPNADHSDPFAIAMGYEVSLTCQGLMSNYSQAVADPFTNFNLYNSFETSDGTYFGSHMEYLSTLIDQTNQYFDRITMAANAGATLSNRYDENNPLAVQMRQVARMISGGLKTNIYVLDVAGFDTHNAQVDSTNVTLGVHTDLLKRVSDAITAFQDDIHLLGLEQRVAGMTFSEFGRQIASNGSDGTDHGDAAPLFIFGACITGGVLGNDPIIDFDLSPQAGVPMQFDFRDIYASVMKDWFEVPESEVQAIFDHEVTFYPVLGGCNLGVEDESGIKENGLLFPNPAVSVTTLRMRSESERVRIQLLDLNARLIMEVMDKDLKQDTHLVTIDLNELGQGNYFVHVSKSSGHISLPLSKVK
jgi:uncharacterized protein (DUF1501 family)